MKTSTKIIFGLVILDLTLLFSILAFNFFFINQVVVNEVYTFAQPLKLSMCLMNG